MATVYRNKRIRVTNQVVTCYKCKVSGRKSTIRMEDGEVEGTLNTVQGKYYHSKGSENHYFGEHYSYEGNHNHSFGVRVRIKGNHNDHRGHYVEVEGDSNTIYGDYAKVDGKNNKVYGKHATINGVEQHEAGIPTKEEESFDHEGGDDKVSECVICRTNISNCVILPCMHVIMCVTCSREYMSNDKEQCPLCRGEIQSIKRLHYS